VFLSFLVLCPDPILRPERLVPPRVSLHLPLETGQLLARERVTQTELVQLRKEKVHVCLVLTVRQKLGVLPGGKERKIFGFFLN
jgi:hypothetical protein